MCAGLFELYIIVAGLIILFVGAIVKCMCTESCVIYSTFIILCEVA